MGSGVLFVWALYGKAKEEVKHQGIGTANLLGLAATHIARLYNPCATRQVYHIGR